MDETAIFYHSVATIHAPSYRTAFGAALRADWPRIPLPDDAAPLNESADLGRKIAALLDADREVTGVSIGSLLPGLNVIALPKGKDFKLVGNWGYVQINKHGSRVVMPGGGKTTERTWTDAERDALTQLAARHELDAQTLFDLIGEKAVDVQINVDATWLCVPSKVWAYTMGGHQVLKKWLSYREFEVLGRALTGDEALHFAKTARRITEILCMGPSLDAANAKARDCAVPWLDGKPASANVKITV